ncbi:hypothetical protein SmJEL517_g00125 [Synchytrium microbalum]|uniref:Uncharacterized protein n=1 Tax=Synchytrium microbalum TaxID=1806994 RepID=A0A507CAK6_9FUNG|nr:uncharacterized protein SmJEL517_g00125 [Synchytrium microbalum]TPX38087.1 hypothetical protein SmJEL517_g00125 [Synchytrium microbalum]
MFSSPGPRTPHHTSADIALLRLDSQKKLQSAWDSIFDKYAHDFTDEADEIDIKEGNLAVDKGHVVSLGDRTVFGCAFYEDDDLIDDGEVDRDGIVEREEEEDALSTLTTIPDLEQRPWLRQFLVDDEDLDGDDQQDIQHESHQEDGDVHDDTMENVHDDVMDNDVIPTSNATAGSTTEHQPTRVVRQPTPPISYEEDSFENLYSLPSPVGASRKTATATPIDNQSNHNTSPSQRKRDLNAVIANLTATTTTPSAPSPNNMYVAPYSIKRHYTTPKPQSKPSLSRPPSTGKVPDNKVLEERAIRDSTIKGLVNQAHANLSRHKPSTSATRESLEVVASQRVDAILKKPAGTGGIEKPRVQLQSRVVMPVASSSSNTQVVLYSKRKPFSIQVGDEDPIVSYTPSQYRVVHKPTTDLKKAAKRVNFKEVLVEFAEPAHDDSDDVEVIV